MTDWVGLITEQVFVDTDSVISLWDPSGKLMMHNYELINDS